MNVKTKAKSLNSFMLEEPLVVVIKFLQSGVLTCETFLHCGLLAINMISIPSLFKHVCCSMIVGPTCLHCGPLDRRDPLI